MNKIVLLAMLCVASANCSEIGNICTLDNFEFNKMLVNSVYKFQLNMTFGSLGHYLIKNNNNVRCYISEFNDKANYWEALKIKHE